MHRGLALVLFLALVPAGTAGIIFDATSPYHHIRVVDDKGLRVLSFDGSLETRMSLADPSKGHFEYTEYFHMPWLWNERITNVLMIGLGGASTQRAFQRYWPQVAVETAELDEMVVKVARQYFYFRDSPTNKVSVSDGRVFLRRSEKTYDLIILDAYVKSRYGSFIPYHLATREFFQLANQHLSPEGVVASNVIGSLSGWRADILGAVYRTMQSVFPQVYMFPATDSLNVVLIGTRSKDKMTRMMALQRGASLMQRRVVQLPTFRSRLEAFRSEPPDSFARSPILTDDYAPVDGLLRGRN
jgi:spermidine synthase